MIAIISIAAFVCTLLGGLFALRFRDKLHLILGFSAGAVIAVAFFDLIPESIELAADSFDISTIITITAVGFLFYMMLDRWLAFHPHVHDDAEHDPAKERMRNGTLGAGSLALHSFIDGMAIGLGFHVSVSVGTVIAVAVLAHDFSDGINTVNMILRNRGSKRRAIIWLTIGALAPVAGIVVTQFFTIPQYTLGLILAAMAGFFLYIGASDLLPESHHNHPTKWTTFMTVLGAAVLFIIIRIAE